MWFLIDEIRMASNGEGESEMSSYAELILSYIVVTDTIRYGRTMYHYNPLFCSLNFSVKFVYYLVPWGILEKQWQLWVKKRLLRLLVLRNSLHVASTSPSVISWRLSHSFQGHKKVYLSNQWITVGVRCWSNRRSFRNAPTYFLWEVRTVNQWMAWWSAINALWWWKKWNTNGESCLLLCWSFVPPSQSSKYV